MRYQLSYTLFIMLVLLINGTQAATETKPAIEVIQDIASEVTERVREEKEILENDPSKVHGFVDELIIPHFDFVSMSKWVLGKKNWSKANEEQRTQFTEQFKTLLVRTYAKALLHYSDQEIKYLSEKSTKKSNLVEVYTEVEQNGAAPVPINYRMYFSDGSWKVVDVVVNGASLVRTYRGEFTSHIRKHGMENLIAKLAERNNRTL